MTTTESVPDATAATSTADLERPSQDRYTGVVVIHGIGNQKCSETMQEAVHALAYWFNHESGLALRQ